MANGPLVLRIFQLAILFQAIDSQQKGMYNVKVISQIIDADIARVAMKNIPSISTLHNFKFTEWGLQIWRAYDIGEGNYCW